jgi:ABC-type thiamin/hydroxymethylpyrimidine transport system permease subunit
MVIDASELGIEAVIYAILAVLVGVPLVGLLIAAVASRLGGRRFGFGSIGMGIVVSVAAVVDVVVLRRTISGEVTGWDLLWAGGLTVAAVWTLRRLALPLWAPTETT